MGHSFSRRDFLQLTGAGAIASWSGSPAPLADAGAALAAQTPVPGGALLDGWFDRPMRWVQLTLVENDPGRFDPQFWLDYLRRG